MKADNQKIPQHPHNGSHPSSRYWSLLFWLGGCALTVWLFTVGGSYDQLNGTVDFKLESVSSLEDAKILEILVQIDEHVTKGTPLVQMDTTLIDKEIEALEQTLEIEMLERQRRFTQMVQNIRSDILERQLQQSQDTAELGILEKELVRLESMLQRRLIDQETVIRQKARIAILRKNVEELPKIIDTYQRDLVKAELLQSKAQLDDLTETDSSNSVSKQIELLQKRREQYTLRASNDGIIAQILRQKGENASAGEPIVKHIIQTTSDGLETKIVRGFLPEQFAHYAQAGTIAQIFSRQDPQNPIEMEITSVTPHLLTVPDQASALPNAIQRGRIVLLKPTSDEAPENVNRLLHGESVIIRLKPRSLLDWIKQI